MRVRGSFDPSASWRLGLCRQADQQDGTLQAEDRGRSLGQISNAGRCAELDQLIRHVAFDFDGTLVRSNRIKRECFYETLAEVPGAWALLDELFANRFHGDRTALFGEIAHRLGNPDLDANLLAADYGARCRSRIATAPEVPGARATLARLASEGMKLFLISATPQKALEEAVSDRGLSKVFELVLGAPTGKTVHLRRIMVDYGMTPSETVMVGDGLDDQSAAAETGCVFVAITDQPTLPLNHPGPSLRDLHGLPELMRLLGNGASESAAKVTP